VGVPGCLNPVCRMGFLLKRVATVDLVCSIHRQDLSNKLRCLKACSCVRGDRTELN